MSLLSIFIGTLGGLAFVTALRIIHRLEKPKGKRYVDNETYEAGYYSLEPGKRPLRMQYIRRLMLFLAADGFVALLVFLPFVTKTVALNMLIGLGLILGASFKVR